MLNRIFNLKLKTLRFNLYKFLTRTQIFLIEINSFVKNLCTVGLIVISVIRKTQVSLIAAKTTKYVSKLSETGNEVITEQRAS